MNARKHWYFQELDDLYNPHIKQKFMIEIGLSPLPL